MSNSSEQQMISIPIPGKFRDIALKFAQQQPHPQKAKQVYLNILAVQVVNSYLEMLEIPTELESSYSWNPYGQMVADVADLRLARWGHLECRPIRAGDHLCHVPPEVWHDRIGYVVVELNKTCQEGKIRGFLPHITTPEIDIEQLQPLEVFIERIPSLSVVHLRQWLEDIYESQWQNVEEFFSHRSPQLAFRSKRVRGCELNTPEKVWKTINQLYHNHNWDQNLPLELSEKLAQICADLETSPQLEVNQVFADLIVQLLKTSQDEETRWTLAEILWTLEPNHPAITARRILDLGVRLADYPVALMVATLPKSTQTVAVLLRVYPMGNQSYLPSGLQLAGLDEHGQPFLEVQAREHDDYIQLKFCAEFGEIFQIRVSVNNVSLIESFIV